MQAVERNRAMLDIQHAIASQNSSDNRHDLVSLISSIVDAVPHAVIVLENRRIVFANCAVESVFGWCPEELIGKTTRVLYRTDEDDKEIAAQFYAVLENQRTYGGDFPCRRKDGTEILCRVSTARIGRTLSDRMIVATYEDVTEQRRCHELALDAYRKEAIRASEEKYRTILESLDDAYFEVDLAGNLNFFNPVLPRILGYTEEELMGMNNRAFMDEANAREVYKVFSGIYQTGKSARLFDWEFIKRDGSMAYTEASVSLIRDLHGRPTGFRGIARDVTMRKQAEEKERRTLQKLRKAMGATVQTLSLTLAKRDPYTAGHQYRVGALARAIATRMVLPEEIIDGLRMASMIHDIGKISIPAEILSRPTRLTDIEFNLVRSHAEIGFDILKDVEFPWPISVIVQQHHERLDGSGYPYGLRNDEILLEAKILSVADVVEAMASHRPYRPAFGVERALEEITRQKGILYDAQIVDVCTYLFRQKDFSFD